MDPPRSPLRRYHPRVGRLGTSVEICRSHGLAVYYRRRAASCKLSRRRGWSRVEHSTRCGVGTGSPALGRTPTVMDAVQPQFRSMLERASRSDAPAQCLVFLAPSARSRRSAGYSRSYSPLRPSLPRSFRRTTTGRSNINATEDRSPSPAPLSSTLPTPCSATGRRRNGLRSARGRIGIAFP